MRCPFCSHDETNVKDSRPAEDGVAIRRRRECPACGARFTSYERVQLRELMVQKSDGKMEPFQREKLERSMRVALRKRDIDFEIIERAVNSIIRQLETLGESETSTHQIGKLAMQSLYTLDKVGYVRYASVYQDFGSTEDFNAFVNDLHKKMKREAKKLADLQEKTESAEN